MTIYSKGLFIGRFQPFHKGHLYLIKHVKRKVKKLIIAIGSANVYDEENPLTYEERKKMIEKVIHEEKLADFVEKIVPLNDYYDDELWFKNTLHKTGSVDVVIGNNEWPNRIFETRGYKIWRVGFFKKYLYEGEKIRRLIRNKKPWDDRVPGCLVHMIKRSTLHIPRFKFNHIAFGGTFDHFHKGHKKLIDTALKYGHTLSIGITTPEMYADKKLIQSIESFQQRKKSVIDYIKRKNSKHRVTFFQLSDIYGSTREDGTIEAIVVSRSTYPNAIKINVAREKNDLPELKIICIKDVRADDGYLISSERIRKGEINREGNSYQLSVFSNQKNALFLPKYLRAQLKKPLGKLIKGKEHELEKTAKKVLRFIKNDKPTMVIAVGDIISMSLEKVGFIPDVKIIDYRSRRHPIEKGRTLKGPSYINVAGTINSKAVTAIKKSFDSTSASLFRVNLLQSELSASAQDKQTIVIDGEEDLLALPAILLAPLDSVVLYGQIDLGVVVVEVTEESKRKIISIIQKFK